MRKKNILLVIFIILIILIVSTTLYFTVSYAFFKKDINASQTEIFNTGTFNINYSMGSSVNINNSYPMSDRAGNATDANTITITNTGNYYACYALTLTDNNTSNTLKKTQMRYSLNKAVRDYDDDASTISLQLGGVAPGQKVILNFRTWIKDSETTSTATSKGYSGVLNVTSESCTYSLGNKLSKNNIITSATGNGLHQIETENGMSYYFLGYVTNNYVNIDELLWRVVRINEDGTIRLILNEDINSLGYSTKSTGIEKYNNSSVESFFNLAGYDLIISDDYDSKVSYSSFCDEYNVAPTTSSYKNIAKYYGNYKPTLNCQNPLSYKIGLLSYDEVYLAGGTYSSSTNSNYLLEGGETWTMSPSDSGKTWLLENGNLQSISNSTIKSVRPVISLNPNVEVISGDGSKTSPFTIK